MDDIDADIDADNDRNDGTSEQEEYDILLTRIDYLYELVMCEFKSGHMIISNPYIFSFMIKSDFINWVLNNN